MTEVYPVFVLGALNPEAVNKYSSNQIVLTTTICDKSSSHGPHNGRPPTDPTVDETDSVFKRSFSGSGEADDDAGEGHG